MNDLVDCLNELKAGKSRDPNGWANEVAGEALEISMLKLLNKIKM